MDFLSRNLEALSIRHPALAQAVAGADSRGVQSAPARSGLPNLLERDAAGNWQPLHSKYDPVREAEERVRTLVLDPQAVCLVFGLGAGYLLEELLKLPGASHSCFLVVEPNPSVFREALRLRDLHRILGLAHVHFLVGADLTDLKDMGRLPREKCLKPPQAVPNFASARIWADFYRQVMQVLSEEFKRLAWQIHNLAVGAPLFFENFLQNAGPSLGDRGVGELQGLFSGIPAILVGAGPSLSKNVHLLRDASRRAVIITTDAAAKPLRDAGVEPHFIATVDPQAVCHCHLAGTDFTRSSLVYEMSSNPSNLPLFAGRRFAALLEDTTFAFLWEHLGKKGSLKGWGSVSTMAFDLARTLGCRPVIFVGQDLAFTAGRAFADGVQFQRDRLAESRTEEELLDRYEQMCRHSEDLIHIMDIFGRPIRSTQRLQAYGQYLTRAVCEDGHTPCINATEGGVFQAGVQQMSLREALFRFAGQEQDLWARIPGGSLSPPTSPRKLVRFLEKIFLDAEAIRAELRPALRRLQQWADKGSTGADLSFSLVRQRFEKLLSHAARFQETWAFLEIFVQKSLYHFCTAEEEARGDAEKEIRRCRDYLRAMDEAADRILPRLKTFCRELQARPPDAS